MTTKPAHVLLPYPVPPSLDVVCSLASEVGLGGRVEALSDSKAVLCLPSGGRLELEALSQEALVPWLQELAAACWSSQRSEAMVTRLYCAQSVWIARPSPAWDSQGEMLRFVRELPGLLDGLAQVEEGLFDAERVDLLERPPTPPSAERVARRALVLLAHGARGLMEGALGSEGEAFAREWCEAIGVWLSEWVSEELEESDAGAIAASLGELGDAAFASLWYTEGAQVLLWALGVKDLPDLSAAEHPQELAEAFGVMSQRAPEILARPTLRSPEELYAYRRQALVTFWRLRNFHVDPSPWDLLQVAQQPRTQFGLGGLSLSGADLAIEGVPVTEAHPESVSHATSAAQERYRAANWLIGVHPLYSLVGTPTAWPPS